MIAMEMLGDGFDTGGGEKEELRIPAKFPC